MRNFFIKLNSVVLRVLSSVCNDKVFLYILYWKYFHKFPNLKAPKSFQEKLMWLKLYDRKPIYKKMVDKYQAKEFIKTKVGQEYVIPTLALWNDVDKISLENLPQKFIIKGTADSGTFYICKDKNNCNLNDIKCNLKEKSHKNYYLNYREWPYKGLQQSFIVEPLLEDINYPYLRDFKFYCFNGEPKIFYITSDKGLKEMSVKQDFFDIHGNHLDIQDVTYPNNPKIPKLPENLDLMVDLARKLSENTYHLRVDFYEINGKVYVGEMTFYEGAGFCKFIPEKYNNILGEWIKL